MSEVKSGSMWNLARAHAKRVLPPDASEHELNLAAEMSVVRYEDWDGRPFTFHSYKGWSCTIQWDLEDGPSRSITISHGKKE